MRCIFSQFFSALAVVLVFASSGQCQQATTSTQVRNPVLAPQTRAPIAPPPVSPHVRPPLNRGSQPGRLWGFVDLHTHPMSNLAFGGKLYYGGLDATLAGSLLPADPDCHHMARATSEQQALGHDGSTHGGVGVNVNPFSGNFGVNNSCGDQGRELMIHMLQQKLKAADPSGDASGYPNFPDWPVWNDVTHQKMWVDWIHRAYQGGLRVMVALATNSKTLGDMARGPGDIIPTDDKSSADLQIAEIRAFVGRHPDFMEVAYSSADVYRIVSANKLAVVLGIEVDHLGNFQQSPGPRVQPPPPSDDEVRVEIDRLYSMGVRYIFPIHLLDNAFGGAAVNDDVFNVSNVRESGHPYGLVCASPQENITYTFSNGKPGDFISLMAAQMVKTGWAPLPISEPQCPYGQKNSLALTHNGVVAIKQMMRNGMLIDIDHMSQAAADQALQLACTGDTAGAPPIRAFTLPDGSLERCALGYPMNSGHSAPRGRLDATRPNDSQTNAGITLSNKNERSERLDQYAMIGALHGMAGVGSAGLDAGQWENLYETVIYAMGAPKGNPALEAEYQRDPRQVEEVEGWVPLVVGAFGTDMGGLQLGMPPRPGAQGNQRQVPGPQYKQFQACLAGPGCTEQPIVSKGTGGKPVVTGKVSSCQSQCIVKWPNAYQLIGTPPAVQYSSAFPQSTDGNQAWNYNYVGVAHYGMLWDFLQDVRAVLGGRADVIDNNFMYGADYFYQTWRIAEAKSRSVQ